VQIGQFLAKEVFPDLGGISTGIELGKCRLCRQEPCLRVGRRQVGSIGYSNKGMADKNQTTAEMTGLGLYERNVEYYFTTFHVRLGDDNSDIIGSVSTISYDLHSTLNVICVPFQNCYSARVTSKKCLVRSVSLSLHYLSSSML
jgi:hypothetical protein